VCVWCVCVCIIIYYNEGLIITYIQHTRDEREWLSLSSSLSLPLCVCVCVYIYTCIYTYIRMIHTYIHEYGHTHTHTSSNIHTSIWVHTHTHTHLRYIYTYTCESDLLSVSVLARQAPQSASTATPGRTRLLELRSAPTEAPASTRQRQASTRRAVLSPPKIGVATRAGHTHAHTHTHMMMMAIYCSFRRK
jgi:hypothetical protein